MPGFHVSCRNPGLGDPTPDKSFNRSDQPCPKAETLSQRRRTDGQGGEGTPGSPFYSPISLPPTLGDIYFLGKEMFFILQPMKRECGTEGTAGLGAEILRIHD